MFLLVFCIMTAGVFCLDLSYVVAAETPAASGQNVKPLQGWVKKRIINFTIKKALRLQDGRGSMEKNIILIKRQGGF